jgi:hypothetical protein
MERQRDRGRERKIGGGRVREVSRGRGKYRGGVRER